MRWVLVVTLFVVFGASDASAQARTLRWARLAISKPIEQLIGKMAGSKGAPKIERRWTALWVVTGLILLPIGGFEDALNFAGAAAAGAIVVALYMVGGLGGAINYRRQLSNLEVRTLQFVPAVLLILAVPAALLLQVAGFRLNTIVLAGLVVFSLALIQSLFNLAKSRDAGERLENRRRLAAARAYFVRELRRPSPALDDAWFPYVLAFGLGKDSDRWFRSFGGASSSRTTFDSSSGSTWGSTSSSGSTWTGFGGGASGGAGASGAWAVAATSMASGVASPSSSSSGGSSGGGGGGGGSSGGGGGGGW